MRVSVIFLSAFPLLSFWETDKHQKNASTEEKKAFKESIDPYSFSLLHADHNSSV